jgi:hypothetical protein
MTRNASATFAEAQPWGIARALASRKRNHGVILKCNGMIRFRQLRGKETTA